MKVEDLFGTIVFYFCDVCAKVLSFFIVSSILQLLFFKHEPIWLHIGGKKVTSIDLGMASLFPYELFICHGPNVTFSAAFLKTS